MPSIEYEQVQLMYKVEIEKVENPETGEMVEVEREKGMNPFEVRISKWLEREDGFHLHGFVEVTNFGEKLFSKSNGWQYLQDNFEVNNLTEQDYSKIVSGIQKIKNEDLESIFYFANLDYSNYKVEESDENRIDFEIVLQGPQVFDVDWLKVDFDPNRGGN